MKLLMCRDKEREKALAVTADISSDIDEIRDDVGLSLWVNKDKYKNLLVDVSGILPCTSSVFIVYIYV